MKPRINQSQLNHLQLNQSQLNHLQLNQSQLNYTQSEHELSQSNNSRLYQVYNLGLRTWKSNKLVTNNKGLTLIELLLAMAITGIVFIMVISFVSNGSKNYKYATNDLNLQQEARVVINQLDDILMESYWVETVDVSSNKKAVLIYNSVDIKVVIWQQEEEELYLIDGIMDVSHVETIPYSEEENLLARYVDDFQILTTIEEMIRTNKIELEITFKNNSLLLPVTRTITLRNEVKRPTP